MVRKLTLVICMTLLLPLATMAQDVLITRNFTGGWDQTNHESQGISLQIIDQANGSKVGIAYWFTYGDDKQSAWYLGVGPVNGHRIEMTLFEGSDIGFLEDSKPGDDQVAEVGTMEIEFSGCDDGVVTFTTEPNAVGSGSFPISRLTNLFNTNCSGGISDDTRSDALTSEQRIGLVPARTGITGSGHADFEERTDRTEFSVEVEDLTDGNYRIFVGDTDRGALIVNMGIGETEYRSPVEVGKVLLSFDPRGELLEIHDAEGAVLTSGDAIFDDDDDGTNDIDYGTTEIEVELTNTGVFTEASGDASLRPREDRTDFSVEIEDVPVGPYSLRVGGQTVGEIQVRAFEDGSVEGELEFRNPVEPGKIFLDFDPRGQNIEVLDGSTVILETLFPQ